MFAYLLGIYSNSLNKNDSNEIDLSKIDIPKLENILKEAKLVQEFDKYNLTQEDANKLAPPEGFQREPKVVNIMNKIIEEKTLTKNEIIILIKNFVVYKKSELKK